MAYKQWARLTTTDFDALARSGAIAICPIGAIEQHGPALPVGTDSLLLQAVLDGLMTHADSLPSADVVVLPALWCSKSNEHVAFPGTVFLQRETLARVVEDIAASVARAGFKKLVFLNSHGGNSELLTTLIRDIHLATGLVTFLVELPRLLVVARPDAVPAGVFDIHAGHWEASMMMACYPDLVAGRNMRGLGSNLARGKVKASFDGFKFLRPGGRPVAVAWAATDYTDDGVIGDPTAADSSEGQRNLEAEVDLLCQVLHEIARFEYRSD